MLGAIADLKRKLNPIGKEGQFEAGRTRYSYRTADSVTNAVAPLLIECGLVATIDGGPLGEPEMFTTAGGNIDRLQDYRYTVTLFSVADGSSLSAAVVSQGQGYRAQGSGAAISYAWKYALSIMLTIPFDDDRMELDSTASHEQIEQTRLPAFDVYYALGWDSEDKHDEGRDRLAGHMAGWKNGDDEAKARLDRLVSRLQGTAIVTERVSGTVPAGTALNMADDATDWLERSTALYPVVGEDRRLSRLVPSTVFAILAEVAAEEGTTTEDAIAQQAVAERAERSGPSTAETASRLQDYLAERKADGAAFTIAQVADYSGASRPTVAAKLADDSQWMSVGESTYAHADAMTAGQS